MLLCGEPVYEGISGLTNHSLHEGIHLVVIIDVLHIHTNGNTPMLILSFQSFVTFAFVIRIHITHK